MTNIEKRNTIKRITIIFYFLSFLLSLPFLSYLLISNSSIQNYIGTRITNHFSNSYGIVISTSKISFDLFHRIQLKNLYISDLSKDTLLFTRNATIDLQSIFLKKKQINFRLIQLDSLIMHLKTDSNNQFNLVALINKISQQSDSLNKSNWQFNIKNIALENSKLKLEYFNKSNTIETWNLNDLKIRIKNFYIEKNKYEFKINRFTFTESRGFHLSNLSAQIELEQNKINLSNFNIYTPTSSIEINKVKLQTDSVNIWQNGFKNLTCYANISLSKVSTTDISYFISTLKGENHEIRFKGEINGTTNNLKLKQISINIDHRNTFKGNVHYTHIANLKWPYLYVDVKQLTLWHKDIERLLSSYPITSQIKLPTIIQKFEYVTYKGNYTGFFDDFVMYGQVSSPIGNLNIDVLLRPISKKDIEFNGTIESINFQLGKLIDTEKIIGPTNLKLSTNGTLKNGKQLEASIDVNIIQTSINDYILKNFSAKGKINKNIFQGATSIQDPNININMEGLFDFSNKYPQFNFSAQIKNINLLALNVFKSDSITNLSGNLEANFKGNSIDEFDGKIKISNIFLSNHKNKCIIDKINIESLNNEYFKQITLTSDIADIRINNPYGPGLLLKHIVQRFENYFSVSHMNDFQPIYLPDNFSIEANLKKINPLVQLFEPDLSFSDSTIFKFVYNDNDTSLLTNIYTKFLNYKLFKWHDLKINFKGNSHKGEMNIIGNQLHIGENIVLQKVSIQAEATNGQALLNSSWLDSLNHINRINIKSNTKEIHKNEFGYLTLEIDSSIIYLLNQPWYIHKSDLVYDSTGLNIVHFLANNRTSSLQVNGKYSTNKDDTLSIFLKNFDMSFINYLLQTHIAKFDGSINARIDFSNANHNQKIECLANIDNFKINQQFIGQTQLLGNWNQNKQQVEIELNSKTEKNKTLQAKGYYIPENKIISLDFLLNEIPLAILHPIVEPTLTFQSGYVSGILKLNHKPGRPTLNGKLEIQNGDLAINLLNTHYKFNNQVNILNNRFIFEPFDLTDENQQFISCQGEITNTYLKNFSVNFVMEAKNNLVFYKNEPEKLPFYGKAYASGSIKIYGPTEQIKIDITQAKTERNTEIIIPLDQKQLSEETDFIRFNNGSDVNRNNKNNIYKENYVVNNSRVMLNFDLDVTPDADLRIIFNPKIGDALHAQGHGNLKFEIDNSGTFYLRGFYNIDGGDYTFTMQNLMNKKFILQNNSTITFTGNPSDATVDILAVYHTRAALYNLFGDPSIEFKKRIPVDCQLYITGKLVNPDIRLSIDLPNAAEETKTRVRSVLNSDQEMSQQFLALLVLNNFLPTTTNNFQTRLETTNIGRDAATTTSFELLTSQLSSWVSQLSNDFDIGVSYRPGDQIYSNEDLEIALSTQLLNNRMIINSNIDIIGSQNQTGQTNTSSTNLIGDINIEYRLTDKLSFKAFNRSNDIIYFQDDIYTRGVGILYREEFSSLKELTRNYFKKQTISKSDTLKK